MHWLFPGFLAGVIHVYSGPDHLAALGPLALRRGRAAWWLGLGWGLGHSIGVVFVALAAFALRHAIDVERLSFWSERVVGVTLIAIGLWGCRSLFRDRVHAHAHRHGGGAEHVHIHVHAPRMTHESSRAHEHEHAAFWIGILHGAAGTSHLLGILPALVLPTAAASLLYVAGFVGGAIVAMISFAELAGRLSRGAIARNLGLYRGVLAASSVAAVVVGAVWLLAPFV